MGRQACGVIVHVIVAAAGLLVLAYCHGFEPAAPELLAALVAIAVVCELSEAWLASGVRLNATLAAAVMALALSGPAAAFAVLLLPDLAVWVLRRSERLWRVGMLANVGAYAWAALAGQVALRLAEDHGLAALPAVGAAGLALAFANFVVGPAVYAPLQHGVPARRMPRELVATLPAVGLMVLAAAAVAALTGPLGLAALAGFAFVTLVPASVITLLARARPVAELDVPAATALFADAIADVERLGHEDRRRLRGAAALLAAVPDSDERLWLSILAPGRTPEHREAALIAAHADERWQGDGMPAGVAGTLIPPLSRVLAVAHGWAQLTAAGTLELPHAEALLDLEARAGTAFEPAIVAAAAAVVARDTRLAPVASAQPRIQAWPGSRALRERIAPRLLAFAHASDVAEGHWSAPSRNAAAVRDFSHRF